jgi:hypothetical protein
VDGNFKAVCAVTVKAREPDVIAVSGVSVLPEKLDLEAGQYVGLNVTVTPDTATNKAVTYKSGNAAVARVDTRGIITAVGKGTTTVTVTTVDGGKIATCIVNVTQTEPEPGDKEYQVTVELVTDAEKELVPFGDYTYIVGRSLTIPLNPEYTLYEWRLDEKAQANTGNKIVLSGLNPGVYRIKVIATDNISKIPYSNDLKVTVVAEDDPGTDYTVTINLDPFMEHTFITNDSVSGVTKGEAFYINIQNGYTVYQWYRDGILQSGTGNPIRVGSLEPGTYRIKVIAYDNLSQVPYTNELTLTVSE